MPVALNSGNSILGNSNNNSTKKIGEEPLSATLMEDDESALKIN